MSNRMMFTLSFAVAAVCMFGGCRDEEQPTTKGTTSAAPATPAARQPPDTKALTVDEFVAQLTPAACKTLAACKNDKVRASIESGMSMLAAFGAQDQPAMQRQLEQTFQAMKKERAGLANEGQCHTIAGLAMVSAGLTVEHLKERLGKTVKFDGEKAKACIAALQTPLSACKTEIKLSSEPKRSEVVSFSKEFGDEIDAHTKVCNDVLAGTVATGQACKYHYECSGAHSKCDDSTCVDRPDKRTAKRGAK